MAVKLFTRLYEILCLSGASIFLFFSVCCCILPENIYSANILAVFPSVWQSHNIFGRRLLEELVENTNHSVTLISPYITTDDVGSRPMSVIREIKVEGLHKNWMDMGLSFDIEEAYDQSVLEHFTRLIYAGTANVDLLLSDVNVRKLLRSDENFDLLMADLFLSDALLGISLYYNIPTIVLSPTGANSWLGRMLGNPQSSALDPSDFLPYAERMTTWERCVNTMMGLFEKLTYNFFYMISQQAVYVKHFQPLFQLANLSYANNLPHHRELTKNLSLILMNTHPILQYPRAFLPNILPVGGLHLQNNPRLPEHLKEFIESSTHGAIYISLGANARTADLSNEKRDALIDVIAYMPHVHFLVKWETEEFIENAPPNMLMSSYFPQQAILAHPNVKGFISACGIMSVTEAIDGLTPILAIPIYTEQMVIAERLEAQGAAFVISFDAIAYDSVYYGLEQILQNKTYGDNIKKLRDILKADSITPMNKSLHYIDLVLRTKGADFLKSHANQLNFVRTELLDVIAILTLGFCGILAVPFLVTCCILRRSYYSNQTAQLANNMMNSTKLKNLERSGMPKPITTFKKARSHASTPTLTEKTTIITTTATKPGRRSTAARRLSASAVICAKNEENNFCSLSSASLSSSSSSSTSSSSATSASMSSPLSSTSSSVPSSPAPISFVLMKSTQNDNSTIQEMK